MHYELIPYDSDDYRAACLLRDVVMRQPIGLRLSDADTEGEADQLHFIGRDDLGKVAATVIFKPLTPTHAKLRQMAVSPALHGKGVGAALVQFAEAELRTRGFTSIETNARITAQGFYEKLGYAPQGSIFEEVGLHTIRMTKEL